MYKDTNQINIESTESLVSTPNDVLVSQHIKEKEYSTDFKERRFLQWNENYLLYRDKVVINRLTQRQSVNVPIIRETIQSWISKIDEPPILEFETRGRDNQSKDKEIVLNELWNYYFDELSLDLVDNLEKKIVGLQGRGFKKWGISKNKFFCDVIDPFDIDIDPKCNPLDLNSADYVIHKNIFRSLRQILANPYYSNEAKNELKIYLDTKEGVIASANAQESLQEKMNRLSVLGVSNYDEFNASDTVVDINESYKMIWSEKEKKFIRHLIVIACDNIVLLKKSLKEAIGIDRLPIVSWASDPDLNDIWSDGTADSTRTFNKITNMYISQDLENRSYRNFGMYFFNSLNGNFTPRAFEPKPFGMYGVPGNPSEIVQQMNIQPLTDTSAMIDWLKNLIQSSVAQTPTERGVIEKGNQTLGEIQLSLQQSNTRNLVVSKNYRKAWKESGEIFYELLNANFKGRFKLYKKGLDGVYRSKEIMPTDWQNPEGYEIKVSIKAEKEIRDDFELKKLNYIKNSFSDNPVALKLIKEKELKLLGWTQEEIDQVMQYSEQSQEQSQQNQMLNPQLNTQLSPKEFLPKQLSEQVTQT